MTHASKRSSLSRDPNETVSAGEVDASPRSAVGRGGRSRFAIPATTLALAIVATYACKSDDDPKTASGGTGGAGGGATSYGGYSGAAGNGGAAGMSTSGGPVAGSAGVAGAATRYWSDGVKGASLDANLDDRFWGTAFGPNGEIYAAGYLATAAGDRQMVVAKYDYTATRVATFGVGGIVVVNVSNYVGSPDDPATEAADADPTVEEARDLIVQSDGKIVVVGRAEDPTEPAPTRATLADLVFFRLNPDGTRDSSFGNPAYLGTPLEGFAIVSFGASPEDQVWGLDVDASDRIYAFGSGPAADPTRTDADRYVVRLTANGAADPSFGNAGLASFELPQTSLTGTAPVTLKVNDNQRHGFVLADGSVISAGYSNVGGRNQVVLAKFTSDGKLSGSFSGDGVARVAPFANGIAEAYGIAIQYAAGVPSGFITTGYGRTDVDSTTDTDLDMVSFRFKANGEFDTSWGIGGAVVHDVSGAEDRGRYTLALPDNRILMFGTGVATGSNKDAMVLLLDKNGALTTNFDPAGYKLYDFGGANDEFYAAALSKDAAWVVAVGYAGASTGGLTNGNSVLLVLPVGA